MKTVETAPKGQVVNTLGFSAYVADKNIYYSDSGSLAEGRNWLITGGPLYFFRYGVSDLAEVGFSMDAIWPGVGGKIRLTEWVALDGNIKLKTPIWEDNPPYGPLFDAALIFGGTSQSFGLKFLSEGSAPGSARPEKPDMVISYGMKSDLFYPEAPYLFPEVAYLVRYREFMFGLGFVF